MEDDLFLRIFVDFFKDTPHGNYGTLADNLTALNRFGNYEKVRKKIDALRKKLVKREALKCTKERDSRGHIYSTKKFNEEILYLLYPRLK